MKNTTHTNNFDSNFIRVRMCDRAQEYPGLILGILGTCNDLHTFWKWWAGLQNSSKQMEFLHGLLLMGKKCNCAAYFLWTPRYNMRQPARQIQSKRLRIKRYIHCYLQMVSHSSLAAFGTCSVGQIGALPCSTRPVHWMHYNSLGHKTEHQGMFPSQFPFIQHNQGIQTCIV